MPVEPPATETVLALLQTALTEDGVDRDLTSVIAIDAGPSQEGRYRLAAREAGTFAGAAVLTALAEEFGPNVRIETATQDGMPFVLGQPLATISGDVRTVLAIERTMLNFLQRLCGI